MAYVSLPPETWESICRRVAASSSDLSWRWAAIRENDGSWKFAVLSVSADLPNTAKRLLRYSSVILGSETLRPSEAANRLRTGVVTEDAQLQGMAFALPNGHLYPRHRTTGPGGPYRSHSGWPEFEVQHDSERAATGQQISNLDQLVEDGLPVYPNGADAVAHFVFGVAPDQRDLIRVGTVLIRLPDRRARISELRVVRNRVTVRIDGELEGKRLRLYWRSEPQSREPCWHDFDDLRASVRFPIRGVPYQVALYLVAAGGAILDHRGWTGVHGDRPPIDEWEPRGIAERIRSGEDERTEFKQLVDKPGTYQGVARTVAAFANGAGGVIFVGVADDSAIVGAAAAVRAPIDEAILQRVKPRPRYRWRALRLQGRPLQALEVFSGRPVIYRADRMVWIRAQGTTREADSDELQDLASAISSRAHVLGGPLVPL